jgi:hypothetical protein
MNSRRNTLPAWDDWEDWKLPSLEEVAGHPVGQNKRGTDYVGDYMNQVKPKAIKKAAPVKGNRFKLIQQSAGGLNSCRKSV